MHSTPVSPTILRRSARRIVQDSAKLLPYSEPVATEGPLVALIRTAGALYGAAARLAQAAPASDAHPTQHAAACAAAQEARGLRDACRATLVAVGAAAASNNLGVTDLSARLRELASVANRALGHFDMRAGQTPTKARGR